MIAYVLEVQWETGQDSIWQVEGVYSTERAATLAAEEFTKDGCTAYLIEEFEVKREIKPQK